MHECRSHNAVLVVDEDMEVWMVSGASGPADGMRARPLSLSVDRPPIGIAEDETGNLLNMISVDGSLTGYEIAPEASEDVALRPIAGRTKARALTLVQRFSRRFSPSAGPICAAALDGRILTLSRVSGAIERYDLDTSELVPSNSIDDVSHEAPCLAAILPTPGGGSVLVGVDGTVYVDPADGGPMTRIPGLPGVSVRTACLSPFQSVVCLYATHNWGIVAVPRQ